MEKKKYIVEYMGDNFICTDFYDTDKGSGVQITDENGKFISEIFGTSIPTDDLEIDSVQNFDQLVIEEITFKVYEK